MSERQASNFRKGDFTNSHVMVLTILSEMQVKYLAEFEFKRWNEYREGGQMRSWVVDILIIDPRYWNGVIEVNGVAHHSGKQVGRDAKKADYLRKIGLWVEPIENPAVNYDSVTAILERHRVKIDAYGGRS